MAKIGALVVTYNRFKLLKVNLSGLCSQSLQLSGILVFDNFSTDNTNDGLIKMGFTDGVDCDKLYAKEWNGLTAYYYRNSTNEGGSGGFHFGMKMAVELGWDYVWIMDDDVRPEDNCLEELMKAQDKGHLITIPCRTDENYQDYAYTGFDMVNPFKFGGNSRAIRKKSQDLTGEYEDIVLMPFEGPLINSTLIRRIGMPNKEFFIFMDDWDYSLKALKMTNIRYVKNAILHRTNLGPDEFVPWRAYYVYRNIISMDRLYGKNIAVRNLRPFLYFIKSLGGMVVHKRLKYTKLLVRAFKDGYTLNLGKREIRDGKVG